MFRTISVLHYVDNYTRTISKRSERWYFSSFHAVCFNTNIRFIIPNTFVGYNIEVILSTTASMCCMHIYFTFFPTLTAKNKCRLEQNLLLFHFLIHRNNRSSSNRLLSAEAHASTTNSITNVMADWLTNQNSWK